MGLSQIGNGTVLGNNRERYEAVEVCSGYVINGEGTMGKMKGKQRTMRSPARGSSL